MKRNKHSAGSVAQWVIFVILLSCLVALLSLALTPKKQRATRVSTPPLIEVEPVASSTEEPPFQRRSVSSWESSAFNRVHGSTNDIY